MITRENLTNRFQSFTVACEQVGIVPPAGSRWYLQHGSKHFGQAFRVFFEDTKTGALRACNGMGDFLGMTKAEAYEALGQRLTVLWTVVNVQAPSCEPVEPAAYLDGIESGRNVAQ
jgi:hypothetical protein